MNKLKSLDNKLRRNSKLSTPVPNMTGGTSRYVNVKKETDYILSEEELNMIINYINEDSSSMILVKQGGTGFYPKYDIVKANFIYLGNENPYVETLVSFTEKQLPENWNFDRLSETFNSEKNLDKIDYFKQERPRERSSYEY